MTIVLTTQQQQALDDDTDSPRRVIDPRRNVAYVLLPEAEYDAVREALDDEQEQRAIRVIALRNAAGRAVE